MGGLTRDEISSVNDKVPFLGDIPGLGRLFRSEGETRQKKNLLIFVTANLVSQVVRYRNSLTTILNLIQSTNHLHWLRHQGIISEI